MLSAASSEMIPGGTEQDAAGDGPADSRADNRADSRRQAYIDAAQRLFFAHGYGATSMNAIAAAVGGSKTTLWSLFPSKLALFEAVVETIVRDFGRALTVDLESAPDVEAGLVRMGDALMETLMSDEVTGMHRLVMGEAARVPELGRVMFERGPGPGMARFAGWLERQMQAGRLKQGDPQLAAQQFSGLCRAGVVDRHLMGMTSPDNVEQGRREVRAAAATFMTAWGA
ncbi:TetR/AcrR family transcriptional regulator [Sandarakinorhabdus oryzae]|uniref:TetR/AcrR family transcriptional regulator n=1 Tax=Sandarakinorhabdus oryzae TaxID=2675220 RepID=UPI001F2464DD|nr:TetR/AcrR family transcriptional regulator [Sandarakinorhabdus oryzae]